jgi:chemotaxis protein CheD
MRRRVLNINDLEVTGEPVLYTCHGLGSCIALFITDRLTGISGGAHIPMPSLSNIGEFYDAYSMISAMLDSFNKMGSDLTSLSAKITGGAQLYEGVPNIGEQNADAVLHQLIMKKIFVAARDVGGREARTARFNSVTRELQISTSTQKNYCI